MHLTALMYYTCSGGRGRSDVAIVEAWPMNSRNLKLHRRHSKHQHVNIQSCEMYLYGLPHVT